MELNLLKKIKKEKCFIFWCCEGTFTENFCEIIDIKFNKSKINLNNQIIMLEEVEEIIWDEIGQSVIIYLHNENFIQLYNMNSLYEEFEDNNCLLINY